MVNFKLQLFRIPQCVRKLMDVEYYADLYAVLHYMDLKRLIYTHTHIYYTSVDFTQIYN